MSELEELRRIFAQPDFEPMNTAAWLERVRELEGDGAVDPSSGTVSGRLRAKREREEAARLLAEGLGKAPVLIDEQSPTLDVRFSVRIAQLGRQTDLRPKKAA